MERLFDCFLAHDNDNDNDFLNQRLQSEKGMLFHLAKGQRYEQLQSCVSLAESHGMVDFSLIFLGESVICIVVALNILAGLTRGTQFIECEANTIAREINDQDLMQVDRDADK